MGGKSITQQIDEGIRFHTSRRRSATGYLAYFQSYSNTYAPLDILRMRYEEALVHPLVSGLVIGTRPDCVDEEKLDYLASLSKQHYVMVEYGIESCYDRTLASIGRGHDYACTCHAIQATARRGIACGGHLILGLPGESLQEMVEEASLLSLLPPLHPQIAPTTGTQRVANGSPIPLSPREPTSSLPIGTVHNAGM